MSTTNIKNYHLLFKFIETFSPLGFKGIDRNHPLILELEEMLDLNRQFIYVGDILNMEMLFTSRSSYDIFGIRPENLNPHNIFINTHPEDLQRHSVTRSRLFKLASEMYIQKQVFSVMSTNMRFRNLLGGYSNILVQGYLWSCQIPHNTVCCLFVQTDISWFGEIKHGYNSYLGTDLSYFRYPDEELIMTGNVFSDREFEIIKLVESGLKSEQIAQKIFLSVHTVNTHRRRILKKTGKLTLSELIHELKERGVL